MFGVFDILPFGTSGFSDNPSLMDHKLGTYVHKMENIITLVVMVLSIYHKD